MAGVVTWCVPIIRAPARALLQAGTQMCVVLMWEGVRDGSCIFSRRLLGVSANSPINPSALGRVTGITPCAVCFQTGALMQPLLPCCNMKRGWEGQLKL